MILKNQELEGFHPALNLIRLLIHYVFALKKTTQVSRRYTVSQCQVNDTSNLSIVCCVCVVIVSLCALSFGGFAKRGCVFIPLRVV